MSEGQVRREPEQDRYELKIGDDVAIAAYYQQGDVVMFTHTEVPEALEGHGVASKLIAGALDDVRQRHLKIVAECRFVASYIQRHPETQDLLAE